jgi:hypothetical protein
VLVLRLLSNPAGAEDWLRHLVHVKSEDGGGEAVASADIDAPEGDAASGDAQ